MGIIIDEILDTIDEPEDSENLNVNKIFFYEDTTELEWEPIELSLTGPIMKEKKVKTIEVITNGKSQRKKKLF